jgi:hypothetical protein
MASPLYEKVIAYIVDTMTPQKVLEIQDHMLMGDDDAQHLVTILKQKARDILDDDNLDELEPTVDELNALIEQGLEDYKAGRLQTLDEFWAELESEVDDAT